MAISVIMSVYNERPEQVQQAVDSILKQTYLPREFVIVLDNPERSDLKDLLMDYDFRVEMIKLVCNPENLGLAASLNKAIELASSELIARMDADDISVTNRLEVELEALKTRDLDLISGNITYLDEQDEVVGEKSAIPEAEPLIQKILPYGSTIIHPTVLMRKTYLVSRYIQQLYAERKRTGADSFGRGMSALTDKINDVRAQSTFNRGQKYFTMAMASMRKRKLGQALAALVRAMVTSPDNCYYVINYLRLRTIWSVNGRRYRQQPSD
ncbi:glycosyltransferase [Lactiplantibacillus plantarum]|uniref:glycosyltransferase n=1 Tax=Lactiplantibacillus plantarum TaxID=1590 RepID=UPI002446750A|nr:glycosyltransferase [Lactiplantibacillus plantarum]MDG6764613.1 glycosyltransferase [Lactiplantibacillus plantarum]MDH2715255.1 glycosyltransferase [Lactiplantibacillus plantarum]MDH7467127.1 glycosyltransferase [Lactiplantibacillus plantarum]MDN3215126.1 glycosyltransferase [Lactiplantibacillus plantarum]MDN3218214.1 glycosyltransferase [Lactiplantibacillus plantarum]